MVITLIFLNPHTLKNEFFNPGLIFGCYVYSMEIIFSKHAIDQLKIRSKITRLMALETVKNADQILQTYRGRTLFRKNCGNEILEVVAIKEDNTIVIITQYFLEK